MIYYDLGANVGFFSLLASRLVGPEGHVFSFEPDPIRFLRLRQNLEHNSFRQAVAEERAVWNKSATLPFTCADTSESPDRVLGHVSLELPEPPKTLQVSCISLDDYCETHPAPDFIRCDVQGAECEVFQGVSANGTPSSSAKCTAWKTNPNDSSAIYQPLELTLLFAAFFDFSGGEREYLTS